MDFDFSLVLVIAFLITGICWVLHKLNVEIAGKTVEFFGSLFSVVALVLVLRSFLFEPFQIPSGSMIPTLKVGDFILVNKYAYGLRLPVSGTKVVDIGEPKRGDVMVFIPPHKKQHYIKRVVGLPGDIVEMRRGVLFVNGQEMKQSAYADIKADNDTCTQMGLKDCIIQLENLDGVEHVIQRVKNPTNRASFSFVAKVPNGRYFMVGDNRDNSNDSRSWEVKTVPEENIVGKAVAVWMHWDKFLSWPDFTQARSIQ
ncbi:signal peptidase I [Porticoccus sp. W117]|uniref:signal peptidase I n=1 Tax=Porticoccus sp. W117 TaxID=3054777 RepID=UPI0025945FDA|nr:signal peptidase I [Porticoccus sp. W117]MDM3869825.1 signal peptidase I [Porticoccus sp. W117]